MIPADKLEKIAKGIVEKWKRTHAAPSPIGDEMVIFSVSELASFVEIVLACGAAHEEHQRKHGR
jgi:hypothetical protein